jgi:hypothetical protein
MYIYISLSIFFSLSLQIYIYIYIYIYLNNSFKLSSIGESLLNHSMGWEILCCLRNPHDAPYILSSWS